MVGTDFNQSQCTYNLQSCLSLPWWQLNLTKFLGGGGGGGTVGGRGNPAVDWIPIWEEEG